MKLALYVAKAVFASVLAILLLVLSIDLVFAMIAELSGMSAGDSWKGAILYVLLRLPSDISIVFPIAGFLGTLVALSLLAAKSELIAMRAAGFSLNKLACAVMMTATFLLCFYYALTVFVAPYTRHLAINEKNIFDHNTNVLVLSSQTWLKSGDHFLLMGEVLPEGVINNVTDFWVQNGILTDVRHVSKITLQPDNTWVLDSVSDTKITQTGVSQTQTNQITETSLISQALLPMISMTPEEMTLPVLRSYIRFRSQNHLDSKQYELQFWNALIAPLMLPIMMVLAIPFVLGSIRSGAQTRIIMGLVVGFGFYIISQFFGSLTLLSPLPPILGASVPILFFALLACGLFYVVNRR